MIRIRRSQNADTRSADKLVSKEVLLKNSWDHIHDVRKALQWFREWLMDVGTMHDHSKINNIVEFHADFKVMQEGGVGEFKKMNWFKNIHLKERHHLTGRCPDDVNLFDVLERVADITTAGMARSGKIYDDTLDPEILVKAYKNTIELLKKNIEIIE